jgi:hypothetical protein
MELGVAYSGSRRLKDREREEEFTKLVFELCKHLTTLSTAAVLVVLAVYRGLAVERLFLDVPLLMFGLTILSSLGTGLAALFCFTTRGAAIRQDRRERILSLGATVSTLFFVVGAGTFMAYLTGVSLGVPPVTTRNVETVVAVVAFVVTLVAVWIGFRERRRSRSSLRRGKDNP